MADMTSYFSRIRIVVIKIITIFHFSLLRLLGIGISSPDIFLLKKDHEIGNISSLSFLVTHKVNFVKLKNRLNHL